MDTRHLKGLACAIPGYIYDDASTLFKPTSPIFVLSRADCPQLNEERRVIILRKETA